MRCARFGVGVGALALLASACDSGSGGDSAETSPVSSPASVATESVVADEPETQPETQPEPEPTAVAAEESAEGSPQDAQTTPSLPANIWPEEIVETTETDVAVPDVESSGKDVVIRADGAVGDGVLPEGVGSVTARITAADGEVCEVCLWLADDDASRQRGLMDVTDLGNAVGMAFSWDEPRTGNFFMFQTPTPLSIAWFDDDGSHVGQADMEPCLVENSAVCERYTAGSPYVLAVEMFGSQLDAIGIGPGSSIELSDLPCA